MFESSIPLLFLSRWCDTARWGAPQIPQPMPMELRRTQARGKHPGTSVQIASISETEIPPSRSGQCDEQHSHVAADEASCCPRKQAGGWLAALAFHLVLGRARFWRRMWARVLPCCNGTSKRRVSGVPRFSLGRRCIGGCGREFCLVAEVW